MTIESSISSTPALGSFANAGEIGNTSEVVITRNSSSFSLDTSLCLDFFAEPLESSVELDLRFLVGVVVMISAEI